MCQMWLWNWKVEAGASLRSDLVARLGPAGESEPRVLLRVPGLSSGGPHKFEVSTQSLSSIPGFRPLFISRQCSLTKWLGLALSSDAAQVIPLPQPQVDGMTV